MNTTQHTIDRYNRIADLTIEEVERGEYVDPQRIIQNILVEVQQVIDLKMVNKFDMADIRIKLQRVLQSLPSRSTITNDE